MSEIDAKVGAVEQAPPAKAEDIKADVDTVMGDELVKDEEQFEADQVKDDVKQVEEETTKPASTEVQVKKTTAVQSDDMSLNMKYDPSKLPLSDDPVMIRSQVEFYFGDSNLANDTHLRGLIGCPENKPIKISHIHTFKRMLRFQPYSAVVEALRGSDAFKVEGAEGEETLTRVRPYDAEKAAANLEIHRRSIYAKGFGNEEATTQFDLEAYFMNFGTVKQVRLRRTEWKLFKGSCFVEFEDLETAKKFLAMDPKPTYKDSPLITMPRLQYEEEKRKEILEGKLNPSNKFRGKNGNYRGRGGRGGGGGGVDPDDWNKRRDKDQKNGFQNGRGRGGRGRGGRGGGGRGGRDRRDNRNNDRDAGIPAIKSTAAPTEVVQKEAVADVKTEGESESGTKRPRDETDAACEAPAAKKEKLAEE